MVWPLNRMHNFRMRTHAEIEELFKRQREHTHSLERINGDLYGDSHGIHEGELSNLWAAHNENAKRISRLVRNFEQLLEYLELEFHSRPAETKLRVKRRDPGPGTSKSEIIREAMDGPREQGIEVVELPMSEPGESSIGDILNEFKEWMDDDDAS